MNHAQVHIGVYRPRYMARREEKVDAELLARLESGTGDRIRVPLPKRKVNEMFAIADMILGGRRVRSICEDGQTRLARIPGKMRRRQWVREGDLITLQPWEFQDENVKGVHNNQKPGILWGTDDLQFSADNIVTLDKIELGEYHTSYVKI